MVMKSDQWKIFKVNFIEKFKRHSIKSIDGSKSETRYRTMKKPWRSAESENFPDADCETGSATILYEDLNLWGTP
jgi:hypothetical protein